MHSLACGRRRLAPSEKISKLEGIVVLHGRCFRRNRWSFRALLEAKARSQGAPPPQRKPGPQAESPCMMFGDFHLRAPALERWSAMA
jgi:hypothetical protein